MEIPSPVTGHELMGTFRALKRETIDYASGLFTRQDRY